MATLLLRLDGPMQSWGTQSRFSVRDTDQEPSKSGVIGLLCAALGRPRSEPVDDLEKLSMGVRVDRAGRLRMDYHTAQNVAKSGGGIKLCETSHRYYLSDAAFLVGLEGDNEELLQTIHEHLSRPRWQLFLGRKSFVPSSPVWLPDGLVNRSLLDALQEYPWIARSERERRDFVRQVEDEKVQLRMSIEVADRDVAKFMQKRPLSIRNDRPMTNYEQRKFGKRHVATHFMHVTASMIVLDQEACRCSSHS